MTKPVTSKSKDGSYHHCNYLACSRKVVKSSCKLWGNPRPTNNSQTKRARADWPSAPIFSIAPPPTFLLQIKRGSQDQRPDGLANVTQQVKRSTLLDFHLELSSRHKHAFFLGFHSSLSFYLEPFISFTLSAPRSVLSLCMHYTTEKVFNLSVLPGATAILTLSSSPSCLVS